MKRDGFTLVEVLIAIVLIGLAIVSLVGANASFTEASGEGMNLSTAEFLIEQIRERTTLISFENLEALNGVSYSPPISADGEVLNDFATFSQEVTVERISGTNFEQAGSADSNFIGVTVKVFLNSREISSASWIRAQY